MMNTQTMTRLLPLAPDVQTAVGFKRTAIKGWITAGLFTRAIQVGRDKRWPSNEVEAIVQARVAGLDENAIRALVERLHAQREQIARDLVAN